VLVATCSNMLGIGVEQIGIRHGVSLWHVGTVLESVFPNVAVVVLENDERCSLCCMS